jgi:uncharacterized membrane protein YkvA (DUF1232 family)
MNVKETLSTYARDKTVNPEDKGTFFSKLADVGMRELETLWHIVTHPRCAASVFSVTDLAMITAAVAYVIMPLDLIPDFIPVIGLGDDATVIAFVLSSMESMLEDYRRHCMHLED